MVALESTCQEWEQRLLPELDRVQAVWFERAGAALAAGRGSDNQETMTKKQ